MDFYRRFPHGAKTLLFRLHLKCETNKSTQSIYEEALACKYYFHASPVPEEKRKHYKLEKKGFKLHDFDLYFFPRFQYPQLSAYPLRFSRVRSNCFFPPLFHFNNTKRIIRKLYFSRHTL